VNSPDGPGGELVEHHEPDPMGKGADELRDTRLPFDLPAELVGLETVIIDLANEWAVDPNDPADFAGAVRAAAEELQRRVLGYRALGRIATNTNSLPARLVRVRP
jgi:hypothetical protein